MAVDFTGINLKLARADHLLQELMGELHDAFAEEKFTFERKVEETTKVIYYAHGVPLVRPEWAIAVGEVLFHLRSAHFDPSPFVLVPHFHEGEFGMPVHDHDMRSVLGVIQYQVAHQIIGGISKALGLERKQRRIGHRASGPVKSQHVRSGPPPGPF